MYGQQVNYQTKTITSTNLLRRSIQHKHNFLRFKKNTEDQPH